MEYIVSIVKPDLSIAMTETCTAYEASRGSGYGWNDYFGGKEPAAFRAAYRLDESDPLVIRTTLKIPISVFAYAPSPVAPSVPPKWISDLFVDIEDPAKSVFSDAKLISRDGTAFYCHKVISHQCEPLQAMFRQPPSPWQSQNEYKFPRMGSASLKMLVQYLYTGQANLASMTATSLIELADAAEMYALKPLKEACAATLWKEVVKNPRSCWEILRFSNLHDDLKDLKYRAMDVLAENYEKPSIYSARFVGFGDGWNRQRVDNLRDEFMLFLSRRVEATSSVY